MNSFEADVSTAVLGLNTFFYIITAMICACCGFLGVKILRREYDKQQILNAFSIILMLVGVEVIFHVLILFTKAFIAEV